MVNKTIADQLKSQFQKLGHSDEEASSIAATQAEYVERLRTTLKAEWEPLTKEEWHEMAKMPLPEGWTVEQEQQLNIAWNRDNLRQQILRNDYARHLQPCRAVSATYQYPPEKMFSPLHHLRAHPARSTAAPETKFGVFTAPFADAILKTALHPFFKFQHQGFVLAVQYAVICRTGDTQKWPLKIDNLLHKDGFLEMLHTSVQAASADTDLVQLRKKATRDAKARFGQAADSDWSVLLADLERAARKNKTPTSANLGPGPYLATVEDLNNLAEALNAVGGLWGQKFLTWNSEIWSLIVKEAVSTNRKSANTVYPDDACMRDLVEKLVLTHKRAQIVAAQTLQAERESAGPQPDRRRTRASTRLDRLD
jgi:hypothetical protein